MAGSDDCYTGPGAAWSVRPLCGEARGSDAWAGREVGEVRRSEWRPMAEAIRSASPWVSSGVAAPASCQLTGVERLGDGPGERRY